MRHRIAGVLPTPLVGVPALTSFLARKLSINALVSGYCSTSPATAGSSGILTMWKTPGLPLSAVKGTRLELGARRAAEHLSRATSHSLGGGCSTSQWWDGVGGSGGRFEAKKVAHGVSQHARDPGNSTVAGGQ